MINLMLGAPGGGKSYESCVYHILVALQKGRKVITNLPLIVEKWAALDPSYPDLIEVRTKAQPIRGTWDPGREGSAFALFDDGRLQAPPSGSRPFKGVWDFWSDWRHPEHAFGPLFVIDECHLALPKGATDIQVEEWFSLHRHFNVDALLITQSYGKISAAVRDLVQMVYRVRKNVAIGAPKSYTRKVQDGIRGEVVNTTIRTYERKYFGLYRSHTQGQGLSEFNASDVRPLWKHWTFIGAAICLVLLIGIASTGNLRAPWSVDPVNVKPLQAVTTTQTTAKAPAQPQLQPTQATSPRPVPVARSASSPDEVAEPYGARGIHLTGYLESSRGRIYTFVMSQNGQHIANFTDDELRRAGYQFEGHSQCSGVLVYGTVRRVVLCDAPQIGVKVPAAGGDKA